MAKHPRQNLAAQVTTFHKKRCQDLMKTYWTSTWHEASLPHSQALHMLHTLFAYIQPKGMLQRCLRCAQSSNHLECKHAQPHTTSFLARQLLPLHRLIFPGLTQGVHTGLLTTLIPYALQDISKQLLPWPLHVCSWRSSNAAGVKNCNLTCPATIGWVMFCRS